MADSGYIGGDVSMAKKKAIELHHVHADGRVTNSFYHHRPVPEACGWHVYLILDDWIGLEFPPENPNDH